MYKHNIMSVAKYKTCVLNIVATLNKGAVHHEAIQACINSLRNLIIYYIKLKSHLSVMSIALLFLHGLMLDEHDVIPGSYFLV